MRSKAGPRKFSVPERLATIVAACGLDGFGGLRALFEVTAGEGPEDQCNDGEDQDRAADFPAVGRRLRSVHRGGGDWAELVAAMGADDRAPIQLFLAIRTGLHVFARFLGSLNNPRSRVQAEWQALSFAVSPGRSG